MAPYGSLKRVQKALQAVTSAVTPLAALDAARQLREAAEDVERARAREARQAGATWTQIGALYGTTKQGAQQRFGAFTTPGRPDAASSSG